MALPPSVGKMLSGRPTRSARSSQTAWLRRWVGRRVLRSDDILYVVCGLRFWYGSTLSEVAGTAGGTFLSVVEAGEGA